MTEAKSSKSSRHPPTHRDDPVLTLSEAGKLLGKDGQTLGRWIERGLMRCMILPNGLKAVRRSQIDKILELQQMDPAAGNLQSQRK